jgi:membrane protease YdiL (CAAX protease family)
MNPQGSPNPQDAERLWLARALLIGAPVLATIYWYFGRAQGLEQIWPGLRSQTMGDFWLVVAQFGAMFVLLGALPALAIRLGWGVSLREMGVRLGDWRLGLKTLALFVPLVIVPLVWLGSRMEDVRGEYPMAKVLLERRDLIVGYELLYVALYYTAWEFFFRGAMLFGTRGLLGDGGAMLVQTIPSCMIHFGKPVGETLGAVAVGLIMGYVALRTRSILYVWIAHSAIGILADVFVIFG